MIWVHNIKIQMMSERLESGREGEGEFLFLEEVTGLNFEKYDGISKEVTLAWWRQR